MALNPVHSIDTLTSHYPVGKYASLHHDLTRHVCKNTAISKSFGHGDWHAQESLRYIPDVFLLKGPLFFVSLHSPRFQLAHGGRVLLKIAE